MTSDPARSDTGDHVDDASTTVEVSPSAVLVPLDQERGAGLVDEPARAPAGDPSIEARPGSRPTAAPRPVLPAWVKSWSAFLDAASWWLRHAGHVVAFHMIRLPLYWLRLVGRAPVGLARLVGLMWRWSSDPDGRAVRSAM